MSEAITALQGAQTHGAVTLTEIGPQGMITLRGELPALGDVLRQVGLTLPGKRQIVHAKDRSVAWMSPDELLILLPYAQVPEALQTLETTLSGTHFLAANVSDARAMFTLSGTAEAVRETLAKLAPADLSPGTFEPGEISRTRIAQVPAALWLTQDGEGRVVCFRSVAQYAFDVLSAASEGGRVGYF
ncbi:sarcosine oxidase subunit gamma [Thalassovita sp.]|jgi:sarcosine oxidase subunit gamma|uniref:sarcosine oxidase subunit gamma n=1 Tax=Thalassovita sp. TaxID=1979401 RepID=UPI003B5A5FB0